MPLAPIAAGTPSRRAPPQPAARLLPSGARPRHAAHPRCATPVPRAGPPPGAADRRHGVAGATSPASPAAEAAPPPPPAAARIPPQAVSVTLPLPLSDASSSPASASPAATLTASPTTDGGQSIALTVAGYRGGRLLLHWGLVGGAGYKKGGGGGGDAWRVPSAPAARPPGTLPYKQRALQTPLVDGGEAQTLAWTLPPAEASEAVAFVLKDEATGEWVGPPGGGSWAVPLPRALPPSGGADAAAPLLTASGPYPDGDLVAAWAFAAWQAAGCPDRAPAAAAAAFGAAASEVRARLAAGEAPAALRSAAASGPALAAYLAVDSSSSPAGGGGVPASAGAPTQGTKSAAAAAAGPTTTRSVPGELPGDLVGTAAYLLWEAAGCPPGADYGDAARAELAARLAAGASLEGLRAEMGGGPPAEDKKQGGGGAAAVPAAPAAAPAAAAAAAPLPSPPPPSVAEASYDSDGAGALLGAPAGVPARAALSLLREEGAPTGPPPPPSCPTPGGAAPGALARPLAPLEAAAARDDACVWQRTFGLGGGYALLATVHQEEEEDSGRGGQGGTTRATRATRSTRVTLTTDLPDRAALHWGVRRAGGGAASSSSSKAEWAPPPPALRPPGTVDAPGGGAAETLLAPCTDEDCGPAARCAAGGAGGGGDDEGEASPAARSEAAAAPLRRVTLTIPAAAASDVAALVFVLRADDGTRWWRDGGGNFSVPVVGGGGGGREGGPPASPRPARLAGTPLEADPLAAAIVAAELDAGHWTLMHRFNRAADELERRLPGALAQPGGPSGEAASHLLATLFTWLRFSAARHLTWQRNYNTQPRLLGEAQDRLSRALADAHARTGGEAAEWARAALACVGRGSGGQAVRDEILNIMHRHRIPELKGTWMEAWHQKLHNNTTPDDVAICEAYLAFLESGGDAGAYWGSLSSAGVSRERLASFDRPIVEEPEDFPDKREGLIKDFRGYLAILKAVHAGADLSSAASAAGGALPPGARPHLGAVMASAAASASGGGGALATVQHAVEARAQLAPHLRGPAGRELLRLDLALEGAARGAAEGGARAARGRAASLVGPLLRNLALSLGDNVDVCFAAKAWDDAPPSATARGGRGASVDDARRAAAAADRARRAVAAIADRVSARLTPIAASLGPALGVPDWATALFAEEVVRGGPAFGVSLALSAVEPGLRSAAQLLAWHVVSPGEAVTGTVLPVDALYDVMDTVYATPTILVVARLSGEEEVPAGAVAVLAADAPDVLSHLAVRARNGGTLLAACFDAGPLEELRALEGQALTVSTSAAGGVTWKKVGEGKGGPQAVASAATAAASKTAAAGTSAAAVPAWSGAWAVGPAAFAPGVVGAKSRNLADLRGRLPAWVRLPPSVAVPYGVAEEVLGMAGNEKAAAAVAAAIAAMDGGASGPPAAASLAAARDALQGVALPPALRAELAKVMASAGVPVPATEGAWAEAEAALRAVWASAFNERAATSMRKAGLAHAALRMAVLVQAVVPASYAFVIHTTNPTTGDTGELFAEVVAGLGEAIVSGAVPGSALAFVSPKGRPGPAGDAAAGDAAAAAVRVLAYPSKGRAFTPPPGSLIFRSDSNGEDLEGYAGAGLYDSVTTAEAPLVPHDYGSDPLVADEGFRSALLARIAAAGAAVEAALGGPQDIEGCVEADGTITLVQTRPQV